MKIDILQMELDQKLPHWLSPAGKGKGSLADIRKRNRDKYLKERQAAREAAAPPQQQD